MNKLLLAVLLAGAPALAEDVRLTVFGRCEVRLPTDRTIDRDDSGAWLLRTGDRVEFRLRHTNGSPFTVPDGEWSAATVPPRARSCDLTRGHTPGFCRLYCYE